MLPACYSALVPVLGHRAAQPSGHSTDGLPEVAKKLCEGSRTIHPPVETGGLLVEII